MVKIYFYADETNKKAVLARKALEHYYKDYAGRFADADVIVPLGGDGLALRTLRLGLQFHKKVYGMNLGHVGAYQNKYVLENLRERLQNAQEVKIHPLVVQARSPFGASLTQLAFNEVYLRSGENPQQARLAGSVEKLNLSFHTLGDGHLIASPIGSYAYNLSAGGRKLHFKEQLLASTSIAASQGVSDILPANAKVHLFVTDPRKRSVSLCADNLYVGRVTDCQIYQDTDSEVTLLWDPEKVCEFETKGTAAVNKRSKAVKNALKNNGFYHRQYMRS